jgi:hypothetical protein
MWRALATPNSRARCYTSTVLSSLKCDVPRSSHRAQSIYAGWCITSATIDVLAAPPRESAECLDTPQVPSVQHLHTITQHVACDYPRLSALQMRAMPVVTVLFRTIQIGISLGDPGIPRDDARLGSRHQRLYNHDTATATTETRPDSKRG